MEHVLLATGDASDIFKVRHRITSDGVCSSVDARSADVTTEKRPSGQRAWIEINHHQKTLRIQHKLATSIFRLQNTFPAYVLVCVTHAQMCVGHTLEVLCLGHHSTPLSNERISHFFWAIVSLKPVPQKKQICIPED